MGSLAVRLIKNSVVYPTIRVASHPGKLLMGVYDEDAEYVEDTVLDRRSGEQGAPVPRDLFPVVTDSDAPEAIYAGPLYYHFGHFLLESLARAWYTHQHPDVPFVWAGAHTWQGFELRRWQLEILDILEITNPTRIIADPARFEVLHVPDIGYRYDDRFHPEHAEFLGRYQGPAQVRHRRLWLSRSKTGGKVRDLNSEPTERRLAHAGWVIAHPETLTVREQLDHLARAEVVAGEEGSAFHALMLLKDVSAKKFHIIRRHGPEHPNMHTIGDARQVDQSFHSLEPGAGPEAEGRVVSKLTPSSSEVLDILDVPVPAAPDPATAPRGHGDPPAGARRPRAAALPERGRRAAPTWSSLDRTDPRRGEPVLRVRPAQLRRLGDRLLRARAQAVRQPVPRGPRSVRRHPDHRLGVRGRHGGVPRQHGASPTTAPRGSSVPGTSPPGPPWRSG